MEIPGSGLEIRVAEQYLNRTQVCSCLEQVGRPAVAQGVRQEVRESVRKLFAPIYSALDSTESADLIQELLNKQVPPGKPN